jgi:parvulin-like peptidyl-prolyl isomerase
MIVWHILVEHLYEAQDLERKLAQGAEFSELAKKHSRCESRNSGGRLGNVLQSKNLNEDFREAALALRENEISKPVRTSFGHHLIKVTV